MPAPRLQLSIARLFSASTSLLLAACISLGPPAGSGGSGGAGGVENVTYLSTAVYLATSDTRIGVFRVHDPWVFWSTDPAFSAGEAHSIFRVGISGGTPELIAKGHPSTKIGDVSSSFVFWDPYEDYVMRSLHDGSEPMKITYTGPEPLDLADEVVLGPTPGTLIGSTLPDGLSGSLLTLPFDGGAVSVLGEVAETYVGRAPEVVVDGSDIYFTYRPDGGPYSIRRVTGGMTEIVATPAGYPKYLTVDATHIYWEEQNALHHVSKSTSNAELLYSKWFTEVYCVHDGYIYFPQTTEIFDDGFNTHVVRMKTAPAKAEDEKPEPAIDARAAGPAGERANPYLVFCAPDALYMGASVATTNVDVVLRAPYP